MRHHSRIPQTASVFEAVFELFHPLSISSTIVHIHDDPHQVVSVENSTVAPVTFHFLRLVTGRTKVVDDFEHCLSYPFSWDVSSIIEPEG